MRIAFYAPMKAPTHPSPSGDRRMGRLLMQALAMAGHDVELASIFRSYDRGDPQRQTRVRDIGLRLADRLVRAYLKRPSADRPQVWFTYHLYHKAPDWIGPVVAHALGIPYIAAEASHAPKQAGGRWDMGYTETANIIAAADLVISFNETDNACLAPLLKSPAHQISLKPFIETAPFIEAVKLREKSRRYLAEETGLDISVPWLVAAAMMRNDQKLQSYRVLAQALNRISDLPWRLAVIGGGVAEEDVRQAFAPIAGKAVWLGQRPHEDLPGILAASDIYVWPAIKEAFGMALLEAQAAGLPVVAGASGGVAGVVQDGQCGLLVTQGDADAFAEAVSLLLGDETRRRKMGLVAQQKMEQEHSVGSVIDPLNQAMDDMMKRLEA